jgi:aspartate-semialdehyde dehydrogenase
MDILGNVVPYIGSEEEKMEAETLKLLGRISSGAGKLAVEPLAARISASCNRVAVEDGHTESISIKLRKSASEEEIVGAWDEFRPLIDLHLPSAPLHPIEFAPQHDRPQPRLDRNRGRGMSVTVGRLRRCNVLDWKFTLLSHNTIRGAAGAAILNAELLASQGELAPRRPTRAEQDLPASRAEAHA